MQLKNSLNVNKIIDYIKTKNEQKKILQKVLNLWKNIK